MTRRETVVTRLQVLEAISGNVSTNMFRMTANHSVTSDSIMNKLGISRKQYYDRMRRLYTAGLVTRKGRIYDYVIRTLNLSGYMDLVKASDHLLKLKAVERIKANNNISREQYLNLVDELIHDTQLRNMVINIT
jgi:transcription initiation factor IIE alpha subunit